VQQQQQQQQQQQNMQQYQKDTFMKGTYITTNRFQHLNLIISLVLLTIAFNIDKNTPYMIIY